jgi:RecB family exonuclease
VTKQDGSDPDQAVDAAIEALRRAYADAARAVEAIPDPHHAFERASALRDVCDDELVGDAATLRALMADRIFKAEELSLQGLADRISVSKSRANQFINQAKAAKSGKEGQ